MSLRTTPTPSSRHSRKASPPLSASGSSTAFQHQKLNVVTRLAIEGKTKLGWDGAAIKIYLKISLPMDIITPGGSIPLFPEENVKIFDSQVHPIDNSSAPYNFSSTTCPLLNKAAKALNLPARSSQSYLSMFGFSSSVSSTGRYSSSSTTTNGAHVLPLDEKYTGSILVSGYNVSFVLPKEFPSRFKGADSDVNGFSARSATLLTSFSKRRNSVGEKSVLQFMAAINMWVPYLSSPPKAPYLLSIPIPRCLSNHIKLRTFPPNASAISGSYASLSSAEEDISSWDLTSDPHVTRTSSGRLYRSTSYTDFADDESSDSTNAGGPGFGDGCGVQGTFPSAERIRVRWAAPLKPEEVPETSDGRRRVGVRDVKGEMTCVVLGKRKDGALVKLEYKGTCKGVWFPGVATLLGMDVRLDAPHCKVSWAPGMESKWSISGSSGFTGFAVGPPPPAMSRRSSIAETPQVVITPSSPNGPDTIHSSYDSPSTASLLRAPLPAQNVADYSFENSVLSTGTMSSLGSLDGRSRSSSLNGPERSSDTPPRPPTVPVTLHLNMNDLLPPSNNNFTFNIFGVVLVSPRPKRSQESSISSDDDLEYHAQPLSMPKFRIVYTETETVSNVVRNEVADSIVDVYGPGSIQDVDVRKTVLHKGGVAKCGTEDRRIVLRPVAVTIPGRVKKENLDINLSRANSPPSRPRTPNGPVATRYASNSALKQMASTLKPKRDGPLMIPSVVAIVTPLAMGEADLPNAYAVKVSLPAPSDANSEWLEFGLAQSGDTDRPPQVEVASASLEGVPVRFETTAAVKQEKTSEGSNVPFDQMSGKEWLSWIRIHVGDLGGGQVEVVYLTKAKTKSPVSNTKKGKMKAVDVTDFDVLLPTFSLPVGRLEVNIESQSGYEISIVHSNLSHQQTLSNCRKMLHYSMEELFYPRLTISIIPSHSRAVKPDRGMLSSTLHFMTWTGPAILSVLLLCFVTGLVTELRQTKKSLESCTALVEANWSELEPVTVTMTATVLATPPPSPTSSSAKWWYTTDQPTISYSSSFKKPPEPWPTIDKHATTTSDVPTLSPTVTSIPSTSHNGALMPFTDMFRWTLNLDLPPAHVAREQVRHGFLILWQVLRKVYHYPLDPP